MSKFLYPIYKLNIESYKKWWLYHKKAGGSGILSEILQGFSFNLANTLNRKFKLFEIEGNSVQNGTPSPDNEVPIYSAGDNENLFDKDNEEQFLQNLTPDNNGLIVSAQTSTTSPNYIRTIIIPCKSDFNYAITRFLGGKMFFIYESDEYPTLNKQTTLLKRNNDAGKASEIIKTSATAKYLLVKIYNTYASEYYTYDELISSIKIEKGNKASGYTPYGMGSINEKISNKNLINFDKLAWYPIKYDGTIDTSKQGAHTDYIKITKNEEYIFRNIKFVNGVYYYISYYDAKKVHLRNETAKWVTNLTEINSSDATYIIISWLYISPNEIMEKLNPQLEPGSTATTYVEHEEQDYSIFVQQPMRSIGDVRDCFVKKSDGWYERHYIEYLELLISAMNNSENYPGWTNVQQIKNDFPNINTQLITKTSFLCNIFEKTSRIMVINTVGNNSILYLDKSLLNLTQTQWKENYPNLVLKLGYISPEPLDLPCTEEQIQQLENKPSTYKDFTIIQSEDETPAYLKIQYWKEVQS